MGAGIGTERSPAHKTVMLLNSHMMLASLFQYGVVTSSNKLRALISLEPKSSILCGFGATKKDHY